MHHVSVLASPASLSILIAAGLLTACASRGIPPTAQMAEARTALAQAESSGAREAAPVEISTARDKLSRAEVAMRSEQFDSARALSEEAQVDADLAVRRSRAAKAKTSADELARSNALLREELDRKAAR